jgi:hypothetical protein
MVAYVALFLTGMRSIRKKGKKSELVWYTVLMAWCIYMSLAEIFDFPIGSIPQMHTWVFSTVGRWFT